MQKDLLRISYEINKLSDLIEERNRLIDILKISPSNNDNNKLISQLRKIISLFDKFKDSSSVDTALKGYVDTFNALLQSIHSSESGNEQWMRVSEEFSKYTKKFMETGDENESESGGLSLAQTNNNNNNDDIEAMAGEAPVKKVRFDDMVKYQDIPPDNNKNGNLTGRTVSGTQTKFKPYRDTEEEQEQEQDTADSGQPSLLDTVTNQQLFIDQQQQLINQDVHIESLADSVHRVHGLSLDINREVGEQNSEVLPDLENLIERGGRNLDRAKRRLDAFRRASRENGLCTIIVFLLIILILLLALF